MFSSLLSKPEHHQYSKPIRLNRTNPLSNSKVLILPGARPDYKHPNSQPIEISTTTTDNSINKGSREDSSKESKYQLNEDGSINYTLTVLSPDAGRKFHSSYEDTIPLKKRYPNLKHHFPKYDLLTCPDDSIRECVEDTKSVINKLLQEKLGDVEKQDDTTVVNYTANNIVDDNQQERGRTTQIQIKNYQQDPMLPPKHKLRKNRNTEPSPPPPILKNTKPAKVSKEEQDKWKIPSVISNWKNNQGFTISLDKRMLAATSNETPEVNLDRLADLSSALESADKQAREDIKARNEMRRQAVEKEQREKELKLQELAELTRSQGHKRRYDGNERSQKRYRN